MDNLEKSIVWIMLHPSVATRIIQDGAEKIAKLFPAGRDMLQILVFYVKQM